MAGIENLPDATETVYVEGYTDTSVNVRGPYFPLLDNIANAFLFSQYNIGNLLSSYAPQPPEEEPAPPPPRDVPVVVVPGTRPAPPKPLPPPAVVLAPSSDPLPSVITGASLPFVVIAGARPKPAPKRKAVPRRRAPPKKTPPRRRTLPRRLPGRLPLPPAPVLTLLNRLLGVVALLPFLYKAGQKLDDNATRSWQERLGLLPDDNRDRGREQENVSGPSRVPQPVGDIPEVVIPGTRYVPTVGTPAPVSAPSPFRGSYPSPAVDFSVFPLPTATGSPEFQQQPRSDPKPVRSPVNVPVALPSPLTNPQLFPFTDPLTFPPNTPRGPGIVVNPNTPFIPGQVIPLPGLGPIPVEELHKDECNCPKPKKKKKREDRSVCKRGTYVQTKRGVVYTPKSEGPCGEKPAKEKATPAKRPKLNLPKYNYPKTNPFPPFPGYQP